MSTTCTTSESVSASSLFATLEPNVVDAILADNIIDLCCGECGPDSRQPSRPHTEYLSKMDECGVCHKLMCRKHDCTCRASDEA